ncbi:hypothetical protein QWY77_03030 [Thalassotalea ponticola]|uniref:hypothetical protein n=1 Tax=Thalassotalea ponticola TaxID=1523392 RepID=UPI0025B51D95|nr:hypothetical protein [Thalassotalea ponticola]MDN3651738.1 hypothetical protein [Thalassotalea ponticola]
MISKALFVKSNAFDIKRFIYWIRLVSLASLILYYVFSNLALHLNHDIGWLYTATEQWLAGKLLYSEIMELNPPIIFYLLVPVVAINQAFEFSSVLSLKLYAFIVTLPFIINFVSYFKQSHFSSTERYYLFIAVIVSCYGSAQYDFGQRDHLAIILLLPYFISTFFQGLNPPPLPFKSKTIVAFSATIGICIKPYFILFFIGAELWRFIQKPVVKNLLTLESSLIAICSCFFYLYLIVLEPNYIPKMVPLAVATYWAYGIPIELFNLEVNLLLLLFLIAVSFTIKNKIERNLIHYFLYLSFIGLLVFLLQSHYSYQLLPHSVLLTFSFGITTIVYLKQISSFLNSPKTLMTLATFLILFSSYHLINKSYVVAKLLQEKAPSFQSLGIDSFRDTADYINRNFANQNVYVFSTNVWPSTFIRHYTKANWVSGFPALWPLPAIDTMQRAPEKLTKDQIQKINDITLPVMDKIYKEISDYQPKAIFIESSESPSYFTENFKYESFIKKNPQLKKILGHYFNSGDQISFISGKTYDVYLPIGSDK